MVLLALILGVTTGFSQSKKTNILFIAIDDLKPTVGSFNDNFAVTPHLDALSQNATVFLNNHTQQAVCGPSRASIMTGKRPDYTRVRDLKTKMRDMNPDILTIPQYFKKQGYITAATGKIYDPRCVDKYNDKPSWSIPFVKEHNLDYYPEPYGKPALGYYQNKEIKAKIDALTKEAKAKGKNPSSYVRNKYKPPFEMSDAPDAAYTDGAIALHAIDLLDEMAKKNQPFFLGVGFKRPHLPFVAPKSYWDLYDASKIELAAYQKKAKNSPDVAYHNSGEMRSYKDDAIEYKINDENLLEMDEELQRKLIHGYYANVSFVDAQIGKIMDKLQATGLAENTVIVVWGDHGWHLGDHSMWNKHSNFEQATRSPLLIYDPSSKKKMAIDAPTEFVDVFPTLTELAGLNTPKNLDGVSLKPMIAGNTASVKPYAVSQWHKGKNITGYSFRTGNYRYTAWVGNSKKSTDQVINQSDIVAEELYDYVNDPLETVNKFGEASVAKTQAELKEYAMSYFKKEYDKMHVKTGATIQPEKAIISIDTPIKDVLNARFDPSIVFVGATLNYRQLNTPVSDLFLQEFTYTTPENCAKQARVHPKPGVWQWDQIDEYVAFAQKNNIAVRLHGPISPQASKWAKADNRTAEELEPVMIDYMTEQCKRFNNNPNVVWMDVVNETVERNGEWFGPKEGTDKWENPWPKIGLDNMGVPKYISKAFEIANEHAPNISLVYNQHGGMEPAMWNKVKRTILYLKQKGLRVDGIGWQAHLKSTETLMHDEESIKYLSDLIDWAHAHDLDFHVTEIDYKIWDNNPSIENLRKQADAYANVLKVLLSKRHSGVVTFNTWGMVDRDGAHTNMYRFMFDENGEPKPAYHALKNVLLTAK